MAASEAEQARVAARRQKVLQLRASGVTFEQIAAETGHKTPAAAAQDFTRALEARRDLLDQQAPVFLTLELERLDALERRVQSSLAQAASAKNHPLVLRCVDRLLRVSEHRAALLRLASAKPPGWQSEDDPGEIETSDAVASLAGYRSRRRTRAAARARRAR